MPHISAVQCSSAAIDDAGDIERRVRRSAGRRGNGRAGGPGLRHEHALDGLEKDREVEWKGEVLEIVEVVVVLLDRVLRRVRGPEVHLRPPRNPRWNEVAQ